MAEDPLTRIAALAAATALGVGAEIASDASLWWSVLDLLVGLGAAVAACSFRGLSLTERGLALAFVVLWFLGTVEDSVFVLAYRAPLLQLLLRVGTAPLRVVVLAVWAAALLPFGLASPLTTALAGLVALLLLRAAPHATAGSRQALLTAAAATAVLTVIWGVAAADVGSARLLLALGDLTVLGAIAIALAAAGGAWTREAGRALVIELGPARRPGLPLTSRLAGALADPELEVRYHVQDVGWLNERGGAVPAPPEDGRRTTRATAPQGGEVVLIHGHAAPQDDALAHAAAAAAALSLEAGRLDAEVRQRAREVEQSRRRLLDAVDAERRALEERLSERVLTRLRRVDRLLARREQEPQRRELWAATAELVALARGLYPPAVARADLRGALTDLAARFDLPVHIDIDGDPETLPESHRAAAWFVCAESQTNVARHAAATRVAVRLRVADEHLELEITDDGRGGAALERGLRGLADRIEALGGVFELSSPVGGPTVVQVVL